MDRFPCQVDILLCLSDVFMKGNQLTCFPCGDIVDIFSKRLDYKLSHNQGLFF